MIKKDIRREITQRWMDAILYLQNNNILGSYRDLEEITGIQNQRITLIKKFVNDPENNRPSYAHTDYIYLLWEKFGVSIDFLMKGEGPILESERNNQNQKSENIEFIEIEKRINALEDFKAKMELMFKGI